MWWCENRIHVNARRLWWLSAAGDGLRFVVGWRIIWWANNGILSRSVRWVDTVMWEVGVGNLKISPCSSSQIHPPNRKKQRIYHFEKCAQVYNVLEDSLTRAKQLTISSMMQNVWAIKDRKTILYSSTAKSKFNWWIQLLFIVLIYMQWLIINVTSGTFPYFFLTRTRNR